jgi:hypothetical protein
MINNLLGKKLHHHSFLQISIFLMAINFGVTFGKKYKATETDEGNIHLLSKLVLNIDHNTHLEESGTEILPQSNHTLKSPLTTTTCPVSHLLLLSNKYMIQSACVSN